MTMVRTTIMARNTTTIMNWMINQEIVELREDMSDSPYYSADMAPTRPPERTWGTKDFAVFWIALSACIPTYMLASSMIEQGMDWKQAIITILLGNFIVLFPIVLNAHAGTKYGINFPIYCRSAFGIVGVNIPAILLLAMLVYLSSMSLMKSRGALPR
jgi:NCS1 family nucleobase:cation symporter-1